MAYPEVGAMAGLGAHHGRRHGDHLRGPVGIAIRQVCQSQIWLVKFDL